MSKHRAKILIVDDEEHLRRSLKVILEAKQYNVRMAADGEEALAMAAADPPDLVILDLCLPGKSGLEVCRELRAWLNVPILVLSVIVREADKITALDLGADDYITKPYAIGELLARVRALLRRASTSSTLPPVVDFNGLNIDFSRRRVELDGTEVKLTPKEYDILVLLVKHADCVVTNRTILESVWGSDYMDDMQTLRVHISNLRRKIEPYPTSQHFIKNEPSVGYRFITEPVEE